MSPLSNSINDAVDKVVMLIPLGIVAVFVLVIVLMALTARSPRRRY